MPSELSSFFSRFRRPVRRQPTPDPEHASPTVQQEPSAQQSRIDRKILQDPSSLIDSEVQDAPPLGLTPSTRLHSAGGSGRPTSGFLSERDPSPPGSSVDISPRAQSRFTISRISRVAVGSEWSTFGRKRERRAPDGDAPNASVLDTPEGTPHSLSPARDSKHLSANSTPSTFTLSRLTNPSRTSTGTHDRPPSPSTRSPQQSPDVRSSCKRSSPTDTTSSKLHPQTPQRPTSYTAPTSVTNLTTSVNRALALDSPHTFGHPTPPEKPVDFPVAYPSPPPPLLPLDHPELTAVFSSRTKTMSTRRRTNSAFRDRSNTLPTNRRTPRKDDLFPSLSLALGRSLRHQSSLPQANQAFSTAMTEQHETRPPKELRRARTVSAGTRKRRMSADWSSYQATVGVNSHANQAWPAEVSREILRLSLLGPIPDGVPGSSELRGRNADPARRPDQGAAVSASFLPFPHPSRPNSPSPLRASATLTGAPKPTSSRCYLTRSALPDGRETTPSRPHSLQFTLGNRTGSEQRARLSMADVKRSTSVIEARRIPKFHASGATNTPSGLGDPDPTSSDAPQAPHLSLAPTPSRSLFSGPTSFMQGEPSTPTPEPRHLSDKSRGKRKAEDNVDLTPPEQKKEGQRATFLLPSESRSKCRLFSFHPRPLYRPLLKLKQRSARLKLLTRSIVVPPQARSFIVNFPFRYPSAIATRVYARDAPFCNSQSSLRVSLKQYQRSHCPPHTFACCIHSFPPAPYSQYH